MSDSSPLPPEPQPESEDRRLESWKEIAVYLGRTVRTAQRWEKKNGLPVRRQHHEIGASVFAYRHELDAWLAERAGELDDAETYAETDDEDGSAEGAEPGRGEQSVPRTAPERTHLGPWLLGLVALGVAGAALAFVLLRASSAPSTSDASAESGPLWLTTSSGIERLPALSPDGRQVVYAWDGDNGQVDLYLRLVGGTGPPLRLTRDAAIEEGPTWAPDGLSIAFLRRSEREGERQLWAIPALGGSERRIATLTVPVSLDLARIVAVSAAWSPDGRRIAVTDETAEPGAFGITTVDVESGEKRSLSVPPADGLDAQPTFSPDGRRLAFVRSTTPNRWLLIVLDLDDAGRPEAGSMRVLEHAGDQVSRPVFTPDGRELVFALGVWGNSSLWRIDAEGSSAPRLLQRAGLGGGEPTIGPDPAVTSGHRSWRLVYAARELDNDIWRVRLSATSAASAVEGERLIASSHRERMPTYSPDGGRIAFASDRSGDREYWVTDADGGGVTQWTDWKSSWVLYPAWSPDGRLLAYAARVGNLRKAFVQDGPLRPARELGVPGEPCFGLAWARRGSSVYLCSIGDEGPAVWAVDALGESAARRLVGGLARPLGEDPTGRFLYLELGETQSRDVARVELAAPDAVRAPEVVARETFGAALGPDGIYLVVEDEQGFALRRRPFEQDEIETVMRFEDEPERGIAVSPDGQFLLYSRIGLRRSDLLLVDGLH